MQFRLDKHSDLPVVTQLEVQIKIALLLGRRRPRDTLPSIRDMEKQLGISRNFVLQAYRSLEKNGILKLHHGKGVLVREQVSYDHKAGTLQKTEQMAQEILKKAENLGIVPSAFGRYLYQKAIEMESFQPRILYADVGKQIAAERASYISSFWRMNIPAVSLVELAEMPPERLRHVIKILTNYIRYDEVRAIVKNRRIEVIPLGLAFTEEAIADFSRLPRNSSVCFIFDDQDFPWLQLIVEPYRQLLTKPTVQFTAQPLSKVKNVARFVQSGRYTRVVVSNRLWENLPESVRKLRGLTRPQLHIDPASLELARIKAGVIV